MPRGNGTGPLGMGAMTGRGMGTCATTGTANYGNGCGAGYGTGAGIRRGARGFYNPGVFESKVSLQNRAENLKRSLDEIQRQLDDYKDDE